jgi:hypothetical protein
MVGIVLAAMALGAVVASADTIFPDGDTAAASPNLAYGGGGRLCTTRGSAVSGTVTINRTGGPNNHYAAGETLDVTLTPSNGAITASVVGTPTIPSNWDDSSDSYSFDIITTVPPSLADGTYSVEVTVTGHDSLYSAGDSSGSGKPKYNVNVSCSVAGNNAPTVTVTTDPVTVDEGSLASNGGTYNDSDGDPVTLSATYGTVTANGPGTWSWSATPVDGPSDSQTVTITATDSHFATGTGQFLLTVRNANPQVAAPSFSPASVNCRASTNLTGISFSDAGVVDNPWSLDIDWGDSSTHYTNAAVATQGAYPTQSHSYNTPGTYTATVGVTDKDLGFGSNTASIQVLQSYTVNFLQPLDNSTPSTLITNTMKSGRVVPVKLTIYDDCAQAYVADPSTVVSIVVRAGTVAGTPGSQDAVEVYADAGASNSNTLNFRWTSDPSAPGGGFWIYNLDSKTALGGSALVVNKTYRVDVFVRSVQATSTKYALLTPVK